MGKTVEYFCTECEREVDAEHVHVDYGFKAIHKYKPTRKLYERKERIITNKHLCICKGCFSNYAVLNIVNHPKDRITYFNEYAKERGFV